MNKDRKRIALVGFVTGAAVALVLSITHNGLVTPVSSIDSETTQTTVAQQLI